MKPKFPKTLHFCALAVFTLIAVYLIPASYADEAATLIPEPPAANTAPATPAPKLEITPDEILSTRTIVRPDQTITIQEVVPQDITPIPAPPAITTPAPLNAARQAARDARLANATEHRTNMLACTVHHDDATGTVRTHIRWSSYGKNPAEFYEAWSNVNFHHLAHLNTFKKAEVTHNVFYALSDQHSARAAARAAKQSKPHTPPSIPSLPASATAEPTYIITQGTPDESDLTALDGLHELYQQHHTAFIAKSTALQQENARRAAELAANPPDPTPNLLIRYWTPEKPLAEKQQQQAAQHQQGGER